MSEAEILIEREGPIVWVRFNRAEKRNAMTETMRSGLDEAVSQLNDDPAARVLIITGSGGSFCAGMDLKAFADRHEKGAQARKPLSIIRGEATKPVIAAVNGIAVAGGLEIALACDILIASEDAWFGLFEVQRGLFAGGGGPWRLARAIGQRQAALYALTADRISAGEALELGLATKLVPGDRLEDEARSVALKIAAGAPRAIDATLELVRSAIDLDAAGLWELNERLRPNVYQSQDALEGAKAFVEKRKPDWKGC